MLMVMRLFMIVFRLQQSGPSFPAAYRPNRRTKRTVVEPMFPALIRSVAFFFALATPFVAALLIN
jgi:hypothetical protein